MRSVFISPRLCVRSRCNSVTGCLCIYNCLCWGGYLSWGQWAEQHHHQYLQWRSTKSSYYCCSCVLDFFFLWKGIKYSRATADRGSCHRGDKTALILISKRFFPPFLFFYSIVLFLMLQVSDSIKQELMTLALANQHLHYQAIFTLICSRLMKRTKLQPRLNKWL